MVSCRAPPSLVPKRKKKTLPFSESSLRTNCHAQDEAFFLHIQCSGDLFALFKTNKCKTECSGDEAPLTEVFENLCTDYSEQYLKCPKGNYRIFRSVSCHFYYYEKEKKLLRETKRTAASCGHPNTSIPNKCG